MTHITPIQVQKFLGGIDYPTTKDNILDTAKEEGADENVIKTLEKIPMDDYNSPNDVTEAIGEIE